MPESVISVHVFFFFLRIFHPFGHLSRLHMLSPQFSEEQPEEQVSQVCQRLELGISFSTILLCYPRLYLGCNVERTHSPHHQGVCRRTSCPGTFNVECHMGPSRGLLGHIFWIRKDHFREGAVSVLSADVGQYHIIGGIWICLIGNWFSTVRGAGMSKIKVGEMSASVNSTFSLFLHKVWWTRHFMESLREPNLQWGLYP